MGGVEDLVQSSILSQESNTESAQKVHSTSSSVEYVEVRDRGSGQRGQENRAPPSSVDDSWNGQRRSASFPRQLRQMPWGWESAD